MLWHRCSRTLSAIVEQNNDDNGIIWPKTVTPFDLHLITVNPKKEEQQSLADNLYQQLNGMFDVLYDDRKERAGVKFNDADLIGLPIRIVVGKQAAEGIVEVKFDVQAQVKMYMLNNLNNTLKLFITNYKV